MLEATTAVTMRTLTWTIGAPQIAELLIVSLMLVLLAISYALLALFGKNVEGHKSLMTSSSMLTSIFATIFLWGMIWWAGCFDKPGNWALWVLGFSAVINIIVAAYKSGKSVTVGSGVFLASVKAIVLQQTLLFLAGFYTAVVPIPW